MVPGFRKLGFRCGGWLVDLELSVQVSRRWESGFSKLDSAVAAFGHGLLGLVGCC
jgi:hypothetical protein